MNSIVVFSSVPWDSFHQRPRQLMSRMAQRWRIVFIEAPVCGADEAGFQQTEPLPGVQVWRPRVLGRSSGFHDNAGVLQQSLQQALEAAGHQAYWLWFNTPLAVPLAAALTPRGIVYDCVDELAPAGQRSAQWAKCENALFKKADLVFTSGPSLYNAKRSRHPDVHCFPSCGGHGARQECAPPTELQVEIPGPRLGYAGVIDERINLALIDSIAGLRPDWQVVMCGPVVGIAAEALPRRDNIHWLAASGDDDLCALVANWDVGLMPLSLDDATKCANPPQVLDYMACGLPVVSTSIRDVVETHGDVVRVADTPEGVVADCVMLMERSAEEREAHARAMAELVARTSWNETACAMMELIAQADEVVDELAAPAMHVPQPGLSQTAMAA